MSNNSGQSGIPVTGSNQGSSIEEPGSNQGVGKSGSTLSQNLIYNPGPSGFVLVGFTPSVMAGN